MVEHKLPKPVTRSVLQEIKRKVKANGMLSSVAEVRSMVERRGLFEARTGTIRAIRKQAKAELSQ